MVAVTPPDYPHILSLDSKVRDFDTPKLLGTSEGSTVTPRFLNMQRALFTMGRDLGNKTSLVLIDKDAERFGSVIATASSLFHSGHERSRVI
jgi:hypothetical protein